MIMEAYKNQKDGKTDDLQILLNYKPEANIKFIEGSEKNFKITTREHIDIIKELFKIDRITIFYINNESSR